VDFFEKTARMYGAEFELAYSDIQRETGTASVTLKRAIQALAEDGLIEVNAGRNSRYARFRYLLEQPSKLESENSLIPSEEVKTEQVLETLTLDVSELTHFVEHLHRRVRTQEMVIASLQERVAELEDKLVKR